jgi:hypothetical protein
MIRIYNISPAQLQFNSYRNQTESWIQILLSDSAAVLVSTVTKPVQIHVMLV